MHRLAVLSLAAYAGSVFVDTLAPLGTVGSLSRLIGYVAFTICAAAMFSRRGIIRPDIGHFLLAAFVAYNLITSLWSVDLDMTLERTWMYAMQLVLLWLVQQTIETPEERNILMGGYVLAATLASAGNLYMYHIGQGLNAVNAESAGSRYAANGGDPNEFALTVALALPMAWFLGFSARKRFNRLIFLLAPLVMIAGVILTGSRGGAVSIAVSLLVIPLCRKQTGVVTKGLVVASGIVGLAFGVSMIPAETLKRLTSIASEATGGSMAGRRDLWAAGWEQFKLHPFFGVGTGGFSESISVASNHANVAHNTYLSVATELGMFGLVLYLICLTRMVLIILRMEKPERFVWGIVMLTWLVGVSTLTWEYTKPTWLMFALILTQSGFSQQKRELSWQQFSLAGQDTELGFPQPVHPGQLRS